MPVAGNSGGNATERSWASTGLYVCAWLNKSPFFLRIMVIMGSCLYVYEKTTNSDLSKIIKVDSRQMKGNPIVCPHRESSSG
jgi:hypothetical protein